MIMHHPVVFFPHSTASSPSGLSRTPPSLLPAYTLRGEYSRCNRGTEHLCAILTLQAPVHHHFSRTCDHGDEALKNEERRLHR
jgi:hypothetical protein